MTAANYSACLAITLDYEGGYSNDPGDPGGPTKYGITIHDVRQYLNPHATADDVKRLTLEQAKEIYAKHYWQPVAGDDWREGLDLSVFDAGVNSGLGRAKPWAQYALNANGVTTFGGLATVARNLVTDAAVAAVKKYNARRLSFLHSLRTWSIFGKGWGSRVAGIESLGVKMVLKAAAVPAPQTKRVLTAESSAAKAKSTNNAGGAVGTGGVGSAASQVDWSQADLMMWLAAGCIAAVGLFALAYFAWWTWQHYQRARAYQQAAQTV
jgi:lysozyme family protein